MREQFVEVDGVRTHLLSAGEGPPLVYLHGVAPAGDWLPLHDQLARQFTVYAPDHPGFGYTERPEWLDGMDDLVLHYEELFRTLELERPVLVGFSFGGWIAAEYAVTYPERVGGLVLLNAAGLHVEGHLIPDLPALSRERLTETVFHDYQMAEAYYQARVHPEERLRQYRAMVTTALIAWNPWFDPKLQRRLRRVSCPTLALWAEHDRLIPPVYGETFRAAIPGARLEILPDCGHMAPIERPEAVAEAISQFIFGQD
jgi:pimeloyl-ACP methyl ester carboxylesterase